MSADPRPALQSFDRVADIYDQTRGFSPGAETAVAGGLAEIVTGACGSGARLLEVGVGTGRVAAPLAARGVRVCGIDIAPRMLAALCRKRTPVDAVLAEATRLPFPPSVFDGALFVHILHLVPDLTRTIDAAIEVVRPGGLMLFCYTEDDPTVEARAMAHVRELAATTCGVALRGRLRSQRATTRAVHQVVAAGATITEHVLAHWQVTMTARQFLSELAAQTRSATWAIPLECLPGLVERATPEVTRLFGGLDTPVQTEARFSVTVARLPSPLLSAP